MEKGYGYPYPSLPLFLSVASMHHTKRYAFSWQAYGREREKISDFSFEL
jgi:hypothetical protein